MDSYTEMLQHTLSNTDWDSLSPEEKVSLSDLLWDITVKACREDFYTFVRTMMPVLIPGEFKDGAHIEIMCHAYQEIFENVSNNEKTGKKLRVSVPPGSSKTLIGSILFPVWCLGRNPKWRILAVAHSTKHAERFLGKPSKAVVKTEEYQAIFPKFKLDSESKAGAHWSTTKGGYYAAFGVGASIAGKRADITICDDIVSEQTAFSRSERDNINNWYIPGLRTRLLPHGGEIDILTRWHMNDIAGYIENIDKDEDAWKTISIPAIVDDETKATFEKLRPQDTGKWVVGETFWPEYKPTYQLERMKATMSPHQWAALYMQNPIPEEGNVFKHDQFRLYTNPEPPEVTNVIISLDTAFSEKETKNAAYSAYSIWGIFPTKETLTSGEENVVGNMILLDAKKGRWGFPELVNIVQGLYDEYKHCMDFFLIEDRASGQSLIQELQARGIPVVPYNPDRDKVSRAYSAATHVQAGRVYVNPNMPFTTDFLADILQFPQDGLDMTDTFTQAVLWMKDNWLIMPSDYTFYGAEDKQPSFNRRNSYWKSASRH